MYGIFTYIWLIFWYIWVEVQVFLPQKMGFHGIGIDISLETPTKMNGTCLL